MQSLGLEKGEAIEHRMVNNSIEKAQRRVEGQNFDARKNLLEYDDVANDQRHYVYQQRNELMEVDDISDAVAEMREDVVNDLVDEYVPAGEHRRAVGHRRSRASPGRRVRGQGAGRAMARRRRLVDGRRVARAGGGGRRRPTYASKEEQWQAAGIDMRQVEKQLMLQVLDQKWKEHLGVMDHLRQGIHLRAYAQKQPKQEYKRESFALFQTLQDDITAMSSACCRGVQLAADNEIEEAERRRREAAARRMAFIGRSLRPSGATGSRARVPWRPSCGPTARSAATSLAPAGPARSTSTAAPGRVTWRSTCHRWVTFCPSTES